MRWGVASLVYGLIKPVHIFWSRCWVWIPYLVFFYHIHSITSWCMCHCPPLRIPTVMQRSQWVKLTSMSTCQNSQYGNLYLTCTCQHKYLFLAQVPKYKCKCEYSFKWVLRSQLPCNVAWTNNYIQNMYRCYVTVGTFTRRGLSSTAKTLRSLKGGSSW